LEIDAPIELICCTLGRDACVDVGIQAVQLGTDPAETVRDALAPCRSGLAAWAADVWVFATEAGPMRCKSPARAVLMPPGRRTHDIVDLGDV